MLNYIKAAFLNRWNLLALAAGAGVAVISGYPDVVGALLLAGEVAYLGMLGTHPKFQKYVDAQAHKAARDRSGESKQQLLQRLTDSLPRELRHRYEGLRQRCLDLHEIATNIRRTSNDRYSGSFDSMQLEGLDRLLWIFLRLLYTRYSLAQFLEKTDQRAIQREIEQIENRLSMVEVGDPSQHAAKLTRTLNDNLQTCQQRLENYEKARANHEFVDLEIDRLENKIKSVAELAVNRREHDFISTQVDEVANSMIETEKTIADLDFATGFEETAGPVPEMLPRSLEQA